MIIQYVDGGVLSIEMAEERNDVYERALFVT